MNQTIQLVSAADSKFAPGLITALGSAVASASGRFNYTISVIDGGLTDSDWEKLGSCLSRIGSSKGITVGLVRIPSSEIPVSDLPIRRGSNLTYARLLVPLFLDSPRLVYIDSDVLCLRGIEDFWENLDKGALVAARDPLKVLGRDSFIRGKLPPAKYRLPYFNAGIIGINSERWRTPKNREAIKSLLAHAHEFKYADQSLLNFVFYDDWYEIPDINNQVLTLEACANLDKVDMASNFHYVGGKKPWLSCCSAAYRHAANLLFDKTYGWITGTEPTRRTVNEVSLAQVRRKVLLYRFFHRARGREYAKVLESATRADRIVDRLWDNWINQRVMPTETCEELISKKQSL